MNQALQDVVAEAVSGLDMDVAMLRQRGSRARPVLEVRVRRRDAAAVTVGDCAAASRAIEARLDADGSLGEFYTLEVSSPGIQDDAEINWQKR